MKKSEFEKMVDHLLRASGTDHLKAALSGYLESKKLVVWDPEEEPLPEEISYEVGGPNPQKVAVEAVRRFNAWPKLRAIVENAETAYTYTAAKALRESILAILDGKEEGS